MSKLICCLSSLSDIGCRIEEVSNSAFECTIIFRTHFGQLQDCSFNLISREVEDV